MNKFVTIVMYAFWIVSIFGVLIATFTNFQYPDINVLAGVILFFTILNTFFTTKRKVKQKGSQIS